MSTASASSPAAHRLAALRAAEARLKGASSPSSISEEPAPKVEEVWIQPSEKEDASKKKEFARLLDRGIIRDNGYEQGAVCVEVSLRWSWDVQRRVWGKLDAGSKRHVD
ncbi:hypothetical protein BCR39DRAFT_529774 [Naematelia encephala]|uniref:Uncharacterized protein n=1 Tax=Naematelia encephala TaxID=71784 RepID=A0A1Y2B6E3_9TREE|nr:hypothetical protein BCR39DRAFT_529774 [Naematelia encephala]